MRKTLKFMAEEILRNIPESRNSDITLMIEIWRKHFPQRIFTREGYVGSGGTQECITLKALYDLPREDQVKRVRAKFNEEGKYYPTDWKIAEARGIEEDKFRVANGYPRKDETRNPTKKESYMDPSREFASGQGKLIG